MYFKEYFKENDEKYDACVLITEVNLDKLPHNHVQLRVKPAYDDIKIIREYYNENDELYNTLSIDSFMLNCNYDKEHDRIELSLKSNLDKFIYTICKLLSIGHISLYNKCVEDIEEKEDVSSISENHISTIILTLEEFKRLDGFCGVIDLSGLSVIHFKGLHMSVKALKENEYGGFERPDGKKEYLLRGEKLFKWD